MGIGGGYGILVWIIVFLPILYVGFRPIMATNLGMEMAMSIFPAVLGITFLAHIVYGATVGGIAYLAVRRVESARTAPSAATPGSAAPAGPFTCKACGARFATQDALMDHARTAHGGPP